MLLDTAETTINNSQSLLAFSRPETDGVFGFWDEYLTIGKKKVYQTGVACSECSFSFERIDEDAISSTSVINNLPEKIVEQLDNGIKKIDQTILEQVKKLVPNGQYSVLLTQIIPTLVIPQQKGDYFVEELAVLDRDAAQNLYNPKTNYFRLNTVVLPNGSAFDETCFFEFLIPIQSLDSLDEQRLKYYENLFAQGNSPTVVALSKIRVGEPPHMLQDDTSIANHIVLSHYLIEGRHKVYAAAMVQKPITLLFFVSRDCDGAYLSDLKQFL